MTRVGEALTALLAGSAASSLEDQYLEFKSEDPSLKRTLEMLADAVVCLANADGGHVVVGVDDRSAGQGAVLGVSANLTVDRVVRGIFDRTEPGLSVPVEEVEFSGRRLIVITVPRGATLYANARGTATRRVGAECRPFPPEEQRQALASRGLYDWSAEQSGASLGEVDPQELGRLHNLLSAAGMRDLAGRDPAHMLRDLRLADASGGLTRAALLLVGTEDALAAWVPQYGYAYQYRPSSGAESMARFRERRPILAAVNRIIDAVTARTLIHPLNVAGGVQLQLRDYPDEAVRELVVNALVHRDYEMEGAAEVDHSPEWLIVSNPGGLVFGVTPANILTHPSTPRNRLLLETVAALHVAERT
ncbi:MAG: RNA-binding domain-containing protein, partial [Dehalococcoidia bacterium]